MRLVQLGLPDADLTVKADGLFGPGTAGAVTAFEPTQRLPPTGMADIALIGRPTA